MDRYIAVDSGKSATKVAVFSPETKETRKFSFYTRMSEGFFEDDAIESATFIAQVEGKTYKIGKGARLQANLETSKIADIHKVCTLSAIAMCVDADSVDTVHVAIGIPVKEFDNVQRRNEYRNFILPDGEVEVVMKSKNDEEPRKIRFKIATKMVCPESSGILYLNPAKFKNAITAVLDIGNLNVNGTYWSGFDYDSEYSLTGELGASILIQNLAQELSARFSRCDEKLVGNILRKPAGERKLVPTKPNPELEKESAQVIKQCLLEHVQQIRRLCDGKHWSLDYMEVVFVGGTSKILRDEIYEVFGKEVYIADDPEYANVVGFLTKLCSRTLKVFIPAAKDAMDKMNEPDIIEGENVVIEPGNVVIEPGDVEVA